jgi:AraC family transcriptional regulator
MAEEVEVRSLPAQRALVVHARATTDTIKERMFDAYGAVMRHVADTGAEVVGPPFVLYPEPIEGEFALAVGMPVAPGTAPGEDVAVEEFPAVEAATLLRKGSYEALEPSWRRLMDWLPAHGRRLGGAPREVYLNDPGQAEEGERLTELVMPLA